MTLINSSKMAALLICAGAIPFILLTALVAYNIEFNYFEPKAALKSYALAIGSFVCGSHWGIYIVRKSPINLLVTSNICIRMHCCRATTEFSLSVLVMLWKYAIPSPSCFPVSYIHLASSHVTARCLSV